MPTYVETDSMRIVVLPDGQRLSGASYREVDLDRVLQLGLNDGYPVTSEQLQYLLSVPTEPVSDLPSPTVSPARTLSVPPAAGAHRATSTVPQSVDEARTAAATVGAIGYVLLVLSAIGGLLVALQKEVVEVDTYFGSDFDTVYPYVWQGIGIAVVGAFQALLVIMVAKYIQAKMELAKADRGG